MGTSAKTLLLSDLRGGQDTTDSPLLVPDTQVVTATNVDYWRGGIGRKRGGCASVSLTFSSGGPFVDTIGSLMAHVPGGTESAYEMWAVDNTGVCGRLAGAATWTAITLADAVVSTGRFWHSASFDGKLFLAYRNAAGNYLHLWDGTSVRKVGMATPAAPTVANTGAGAYAATIRYYKTSYVEMSGATRIRRSELSPVVSFTPSGGGTAARVTKPAAVNWGETHWELWGSADGLLYYLIAVTAVATTTFDDSTAPSGYAAILGTVPPIVGENTPPPSCKYIVADGQRLLMAGAWETSGGYTTPKTSRVWFTPVLGSSDIGDAERIPSDHYVDVGERDGTFITGLAVHYGAVYVFKFRSIWKLIPTGNADAPYQVSAVSRSVGALCQQSIVAADDEYGNPCIYFLSSRGPYRFGPGGLQYLGHDNETTWNTNLTAIMNHPDATFAIAHLDRHQVWFWLPSSSTDPGPKLLHVFDTARGRTGPDGVRGGWSNFTGAMAAAWCGCYFPSTIGASMSSTRSPMISSSAGTTPLIYKGDTGTQDVAANYAGLITTKAYALGGLSRVFGVGSPVLIGEKQTTATTITVGMIRDFGAETRTATVTLTAAGSETTVIKKVDGLDNATCTAVQFTIGDASAANVAWTLDALVVPYHAEEPR